MSDPIRLTAYYKKMGNEIKVVEVVRTMNMGKPNGNLFMVWFLTDMNDQTYFHFYAKDELDAFKQAQEYILEKEQASE